MKNFLLLLSLTALSVLGGCSTSTDSSSETSEESSAEAYAMNEEAPAGDYVHVVTFAEKLAVIPASSTIPDFESIAEDLPAAEGFTWVHLKGTVTNNGSESESVDSTNVGVVDSAGNMYSVSTDTTLYVEDNKSPVYISVQPTQTVEWEGYFMVPATATGLQFYGNDLSFLPEYEVYVDLGL